MKIRCLNVSAKDVKVNDILLIGLFYPFETERVIKVEEVKGRYPIKITIEGEDPDDISVYDYCYEDELKIIKFGENK